MKIFENLVYLEYVQYCKTDQQDVHCKASKKYEGGDFFTPEVWIALKFSSTKISTNVFGENHELSRLH